MRVRFSSLLSLLFVLSITLHAFGQGGSISNGQLVSGHLSSGTQVDSWSFTVPANAPASNSTTVCFSLDYPQGTPAYEQNFQPVIYLPSASGGYTPPAHASPSCAVYNQPSGTYQVSVSNGSTGPNAATTPGDYVLKLTLGGYPFAVSGYGGDIGNGVYNATENGDLFDIWAFAANAGDSLSITLGGGTAQSRLCILSTAGTGTNAGTCTSANGPTLTYSPSISGTFVLLTSTASPHGAAANYTLTLSGSSAPPPPDAKANGAYCQQCSQGGFAAGDPVNVATGNLFEDIIDYQSPGLNKLSLERYYNSAENTYNLHATLLGANWRTNYDRYLRVGGPGIMIAERANGQVFAFKQQSSGGYLPDSDVNLTLSDALGGGLWTITDVDGTVESYNLSNTPGTYPGLYFIKYRNGYAQALQYQGTAQSRVVDTYNRILAVPVDANNHLTGITAPDGSTISYGYSTVGGSTLLTTVTHPTGTETYNYIGGAQSFLLSSLVDGTNHTFARWQYDSSNRVISSQHGTAGQPGDGADKVTFQYNADGSRQLTNALGQVETYKFSTLQNVPKLTEVDRGPLTRTQSYDSNGFLSGFTDFKGNQTSITRNNAGLPTTIVKAVAQSGVTQTTTIAYDQTQVNQPATVTESGVTTTYTYDSAGNVLTKTLTDTSANPAPARTYTYTYQQTPVGYLRTSATGPRTDVTATTTYGYDPNTGYLNAITDALGHATQFGGFTSSGQPTTITDANGVVTTLTYDQQQRIVSSSVATTAGARLTSFTYDAAGNLTKVTQPDNSALSYTYDTAHRVIQMADSQGAQHHYTLDAAGNVTAETVNANPIYPPAPTTWQHSATFDTLGRKLTDVDGANQTTSYAYDANGNPTSITDARNHTSTQVFDALNRLTQVTDRANGVTTTTYDAQNRPLTVTAPNGAVTSYTYDGFGDVIQEVSADRGTTTYSYDRAGNLTQKVDALGITANYTYDALDRRTAVIYPASAAENVAYTYDQSGHGFGIGRLTSMTDPAGSLSRSYDERGNLTSEARTRGTLVQTTGYAYDAANRVTYITYPDGMGVSYVRKNNGAVATASVHTGGTVQSTIKNVLHAPMGPITSALAANSATETWTYDLDYRLTGVTGGAFYQRGYIYDGNGNPTSITDSVTPANNQTITYDNLDRLLTASGAYGAETFGYDANGNRTTAGATTNTYAANSNRLTAVAGQAVTTNANGNITGIAYATPISFIYHDANRLASVTIGGGTALTYTYDGFGQRIAKTDTAQRFQTYGLNGELLAVTDNLGHTQTDYIYVDGIPVATFTPSGTKGITEYVYADRSGTPVKLADANRAVVWSMATADPFGAPNAASVNTVANDLRFPGQEYESSTGHNHNGFRDYAPSLGRYLESDPTGLGGGINTYAYVSNSPARFTDRFGLADIDGTSATASEGPEEHPVIVPIGPGYEDEPNGGKIYRPGASAPVAGSGSANPNSTGYDPRSVPSPYRLTGAGENYTHYSTGDPDYCRVGPNGQLAPGTFAGTQPGLSSDQAGKTYNLPDQQYPRTVQYPINPPQGIPIIGPRPVTGGTGQEVIFPNGSPSGTAGTAARTPDAPSN